MEITLLLYRPLLTTCPPRHRRASLREVNLIIRWCIHPRHKTFCVRTGVHGQKRYVMINSMCEEHRRSAFLKAGGKLELCVEGENDEYKIKVLERRVRDHRNTLARHCTHLRPATSKRPRSIPGYLSRHVGPGIHIPGCHACSFRATVHPSFAPAAGPRHAAEGR